MLAASRHVGLTASACVCDCATVEMTSRHELQSRVEALEQQLSDVNNANARLSLELKRMRRAGGGGGNTGSHTRTTSPVSMPAAAAAPDDGPRPTPNTGKAAVRSAAASSARRRRLRQRTGAEGGRSNTGVVRGIFGSPATARVSEASPAPGCGAEHESDPTTIPAAADSVPSPGRRGARATVSRNSDSGARLDGRDEFALAFDADAGADAEMFVDASQVWGARAPAAPSRTDAQGHPPSLPAAHPRRRVSIYAARQSIIGGRQSNTRGTASDASVGASRSRAGALAGVMAALDRPAA